MNLPKDVARRLLAENPGKPLIGYKHEGQSGLADRATLELWARDEMITRAADVDDAFHGATEVLLFKDFKARRENSATTRVVDATAIDAFRRALAVDDDLEHAAHCMCMGDEMIEVLRGAQSVARIVVHHGRRVRWSDRWTWDAPLVAGDTLMALLDQHGARYVKPPPKTREELEAEHHPRFMAAAPPEAQPIIAELISGKVDVREAARAVARALAKGSNAGSFVERVFAWKAASRSASFVTDLDDLIPLVLGVAPLPAVVRAIAARPHLHEAGIHHLFDRAILMRGEHAHVINMRPARREDVEILIARVPEIFGKKPAGIMQVLSELPTQP